MHGALNFGVLNSVTLLASTNTELISIIEVAVLWVVTPYSVVPYHNFTRRHNPEDVFTLYSRENLKNVLK
jgi:hypothetical protein